MSASQALGHRRDVVARELSESEICWDLAPLPLPPPMSAIDQVVEATIDALSYRLIVVEAFDRLRELTLALDRARAEIVRLREQLRAKERP